PVRAVAQSTSAGATTRSPATSPSHHVHHTEPYWSQRPYPPRMRLVTPKVGESSVLTRLAATAKRDTSRARSNARGPFAKRWTREAPASASSVLPTATPSDVATEPWVVRLTRNAPAKIAGQTRGPARRTAASAMPVGGHTGVALAWT